MSAELREKVRAALPPQTLALMDRIEDFAGTQIRVEPNPHPHSPTDPNPNAAAAETWHDRAFIFLRDLDNIDPHSILHELLHIERYWIEGVPQVLPAANVAANLPVTSSIENSLEHLIIVPREAGYGYDPFPYWNETARLNWGRYPWPEITNPFARRKNCLIGWLGEELVNDPEVAELARDCIRAEGLLEVAEKFRARINQLLGSKPRTVSCVLRFLDIPNPETTLVYYDVRNRMERRQPVPAH